jgi:malonate transporter
MIGVLTGFGIIGFVIAVGYIVQRVGILKAEAQVPLNRLAFFVTSPALLFTVLAKSDVRVLFSSYLVVTVLTVAIAVGLYVLTSRLFFPRAVPETAVGASASVHANANNIGLPVAIYVLGDAQLVAPLLLLQLIVLGPVVLTILDTSTRGKVSVRSFISQPVRNPIIIASMLGLVVALVGVPLPGAVMAPFELIGAATIPLVLMTFGMSLVGQRPLAAGTGRRDVITASVLKAVVMPLIAYLLGHFAFGLSGQPLFALVVLAALPTAQNVYNFASRYERGVIIARDTVLITTIAAVPILILIAALLAPAAG